MDYCSVVKNNQRKIASIQQVLNSNALSEPIHPIKIPSNLNNELVHLGNLLFHEKKLSGDDTISCASCHSIEGGGVNGLKFGIGVNGATGTINVPTILNATNNFVQFWDGRAESLFDQIEGPINLPVEMASNWPDVLKELKADTEYGLLFSKSFDDGITVQNIKLSIAEFEKSLVTPSRFDAYLLGDTNAITSIEKEGYALFKYNGCIVCHQGQNIGGNMYQKLGITGDYFANRGQLTIEDNGRFNVTENEMDRHYFKVPTLRNIALTAPYFHDGSTKTLKEAINVMAKYQVGRKINEEDVIKIEAFLISLTGDSLSNSLKRDKIKAIVK